MALILKDAFTPTNTANIHDKEKILSAKGATPNRPSPSSIFDCCFFDFFNETKNLKIKNFVSSNSQPLMD